MKRHCLAVLAGFVVATLAGCADERASAEPQTPEDRGRALVEDRGCTACHALDATRGIGPGWGGIYGTTRRLKEGGTVVADEDYLRRAMRDPSADIVDGFDNVMVPAAVDDAQIADIIALIKSLGALDPRETPDSPGTTATP
ncbi:MAG TPA: c-type cytochrome [Pseudomonadales bacterium]